jgi:hypothetical protein
MTLTVDDIVELLLATFQVKHVALREQMSQDMIKCAIAYITVHEKFNTQFQLYFCFMKVFFLQRDEKHLAAVKASQGQLNEISLTEQTSKSFALWNNLSITDPLFRYVFVFDNHLSVIFYLFMLLFSFQCNDIGDMFCVCRFRRRF